VGQQAAPVRQHLEADPAFQDHSLRFLENHDEPRAAATFPPPVRKAAAVISLLGRGLRFFYEGQLEGRKVQVSMHLGRRRLRGLAKPTTSAPTGSSTSRDVTPGDARRPPSLRIAPRVHRPGA
jgi:hypothetical protein